MTIVVSVVCVEILLSMILTLVPGGNIFKHYSRHLDLQNDLSLETKLSHNITIIDTTAYVNRLNNPSPVENPGV